MSFYEEVYCLDEDKFVEGLTFDHLTTCPTNAGHVIDTTRRRYTGMIRQGITSNTVTTATYPEYTPVRSYITQGSKFFISALSRPIAIKIVASVDEGEYAFRVRNPTNNTILYEQPGLTNTEPQIITVFSKDMVNRPVDEAIIDLEFKTDNLLTIRGVTAYLLSS